MVSTPTYRALLGKGACCLRGIGTYLWDTVGQGCRLLSGVKQTSQALWCRGAGCVSCDGIHFPCTVGQESRLFKRCQNLPQMALWGSGAGCLSHVGTYLPVTTGQWCRLFNWCWNQPPRHCGAGIQAVKALLQPTSRALKGRDAGCLRGVGTYLPGTVGQGCRLFKWC